MNRVKKELSLEGVIPILTLLTLFVNSCSNSGRMRGLGKVGSGLTSRDSAGDSDVTEISTRNISGPQTTSDIVNGSPAEEKDVKKQGAVKKPVNYSGYLSIGAGVGGGPHVREFKADKALAEKSSFFSYDEPFRGGVHTASWSDKNGGRYLAVGAGPGGGPHVKLFKDGAEMQSFFAYAPGFAGGVYVALADFNKDNVPDIVTGAGGGGGPHVRILDGSNLAPLAEYFEFDDPNLRTGVRVAAGDFNGDGTPDVAAAPGNGGGPRVRVKSGSDFTTVLADFFAYEPNFTAGVHLGAGRFVANSKVDYLVTGAGYTGDDKAVPTAADTGGGPHVRVLNLSNGAPVGISDYYAYDVSWRGGVRVATTDFNNDGLADVVTCPGPGGGPHLKINSGATANPLLSIYAFDQGFRGGCFVGGHAYSY